MPEWEYQNVIVTLNSFRCKNAQVVMRTDIFLEARETFTEITGSAAWVHLMLYDRHLEITL